MMKIIQLEVRQYEQEGLFLLNKEASLEEKKRVNLQATETGLAAILVKHSAIGSTVSSKEDVPTSKAAEQKEYLRP